MKNTTGLVKLKENEVRSGGDVAMGAASAAATGAQMGAQFGPYGAAAGAVIGGVAGLASGLSGRDEELRQRRKIETYNKGVESLEGRGDNSQRYVFQAENGMYVDEEGRGRYNAKVEAEKGEKVYDKNWNILHNFDKESAPTHEDIKKTGDKSTTKVLPEGATVVPKKDLDKVESLIKRYKIRGDKRAGESLDKIRKDYKTTEEAMGKAKDGIFNIPGDKDWDYAYQQGKWMTRPYGTEQDFEDMKSNPDWAEGIPALEKRFGFYQTEEESGINPNYKEEKREGSIYEAPYKFKPGSAENTVENQDSKEDNFNKGMKGINSVAKYASVGNNIYQGLQPIDRVERRFYTPDDIKYQDRSETSRRAATEQRNAANRSVRGRGISAGQAQSYATQTGARYQKVMDQINEGEARRYDTIQNFNTNQRNRSRQTNLQLANQYDMQDAQAEAVRQRYMDTGLSEISTLAQIGEQRQGMRNRNAKQYEIDEMRLNFMNQWFPNFGIDKEKVSYRKDIG